MATDTQHPLYGSTTQDQPVKTALELLVVYLVRPYPCQDKTAEILQTLNQLGVQPSIIKNAVTAVHDVNHRLSTNDIVEANCQDAFLQESCESPGQLECDAAEESSKLVLTSVDTSSNNTESTLAMLTDAASSVTTAESERDELIDTLHKSGEAVTTIAQRAKMRLTQVERILRRHKHSD